MDSKKEAGTKACKVLYEVVTNDQLKLEYGARQRDRIKEALRDGETITGYRVKFLEEAVSKLFHMLGETSAEFNRKYPHDKFSTQDLSDILATAWSRLKNYQKKLGG
jgi:hypothetical protein